MTLYAGSVFKKEGKRKSVNLGFTDFHITGLFLQIEIPLYICWVITIHSDARGRGRIMNTALYFMKAQNINGIILKCYSNPAVNKVVPMQA